MHSLLNHIFADSVELQAIREILSEKDIELKTNWERGRLRDVTIGIKSTQQPLIMFEAVGRNDIEMWSLTHDE